MSRGLLMALLLACSGCFKLDPFLFAPVRTDAYVFDPNSTDPKDVVDVSRIERLSVTENDQITLGAVLVHAVGTPLGHVIFFHGQADTLDGNFPRIKRLSNVGFDVFAVDPRGYGTSTNVTPTEDGIGQDELAALAFYQARLPAGTLISYYGHSLGTAIGAQLAVAQLPHKLVLESAFTSVAGLKSDSSGMDFPVGFISNTTYDTEARLPKIHCPLLLIHGLADDYVRPEFSEQLYAVANDPKQLILVPGANHTDIPEVYGDGWDTAMRAGLDDGP